MPSYRKYILPSLVSAGTVLGRSYLRGWGSRLSARKGGAAISKTSKLQGKAVPNRVRNAMPKREKRYHDYGPTNFNMGTTGNVNLINQITTGDNDYHRNGSTITMAGVTLRGYYVGGTTQTTPSIGRILIVYDKQPRGAMPVIADMLQGASPTHQINGDHSDRFLILFDKLYSCTGEGDTLSGGHPAGTVQEYVRVNQKAIWESTNGDGAIADFIRGALYIVVVGAGVDDTTSARFNLSTRVHFVDES